MHIDDTSTATAVESRLARLESALQTERARRRRLERLSILGAVVMAGLGALAAGRASSIVDIVQTRRLEVLDDSDRVVLVATAARHGGRVDIWDDTAANVARLGANGVGGDLSLFDRRGRRSLSAFSDTDAGRLEIAGLDGTPALIATADRHGGRVAAVDGKGRDLARLAGHGAHGVLAAGVADRDLVVLDGADAGGRLVVRPEDGEGGAIVRGRGEIRLDDGTRSIVRLATGDAGGTLQLADASGKPRMDATASNAGGLLEIRNDQGTPIVAVGIGETGSGIRIRNPEGVAVAAMGVDAGSGGGIAIAAQDGTRVGGLGVGETGGRFTLAGLDGRSLIDAGGDGDGGRIEVRDAEERTVATIAGAGNGGRIAVGLEPAGTGISLDAAGTGTPTISLLAPGGRAVALAATPSGGLLNLFDADGSLAVATGAATDGPGGVISIRNERGIEVVRAGTTSDDRGLIAVSDATGGRTRRISP
jgi:hypothetical protein